MVIIKLIKKINIDLTSVCNGKCRLCPRNMDHPLFKDGLHLSWNAIENLFTPNVLACVNEFSLCGRFGDPIFYSRLFNVIDIMKHKKVFVSTNASIHPKEWWQELAYRLRYAKEGRVAFCLDGVGEIHSRYRGTDFDTVYGNMRAFIDAGGWAVWKFIVFRHNEHQLTQAGSMAAEVGCREFQIRQSREYVRGLDKPIQKLHTPKRGCMLDDGLEPSVDADGRVTMCCHWYRSRWEGERTLNDSTFDEIVMSDVFLKQLRQRKKLEKCKQRCI